MERTLSPEERVKRAEEIYYRRKENRYDIRVDSSRLNRGQEKRVWPLYRKMILQILICIVIYVVFYVVKNNQYVFSQDVMNQTQAFLKTDINFQQVTEQVNEFWNNNGQNFNFWSTWFNHQDENIDDENEDQQNTEQEDNNQEKQEQNSDEQSNAEQSNKQNTETSDGNNQNTVENNTNEQNSNTETNNNTTQTNTQTTNEANAPTNQTVGIGGASNEKTVTTSSDESSQKTQMELDAEYIKKNFSMQLPVKGTITSHYGKRQATEIVSANHQGIDIGVVVGTTIVASMEGTVSLVSDEGEYGTHVKIVNKDVTTIYAHCSKILVKEGQTVKKGQQIALSGNTGKTTGPHLHFEIRRDERTVDPELILNWS